MNMALNDEMRNDETQNVSSSAEEDKIVLVASCVPDKDACAAWLNKEFGQGLTVVLLGDTAFSAGGFKTLRLEASEEALMQQFMNAEELILVAPSLELLYGLAKGEEQCPLLKATLRTLLWGARISVLLDFEPPRFARGTFFEKLVDTMEALGQMGIAIRTYRAGKKKCNPDKYSLVTEQDVMEAKKQGKKRIACTKNAIITPLARDAMKECGIREEI